MILDITNYRDWITIKKKIASFSASDGRIIALLCKLQWSGTVCKSF